MAKRSVEISSFKYRPNVAGEVRTRDGKVQPPGKYGPSLIRGDASPIVLVFGVWGETEKSKYGIDEPLLTGINLNYLTVDDIIKIGGPLDADGMPTGGYLREIMSAPGSKARYDRFISVMNNAYGGGFAEKVLHRSKPFSVTDTGRIHPHGAWRTYAMNLRSNPSIRRIDVDEFVRIAAQLKSKKVSGKEFYHKLLQDVPGKVKDINVEPKKKSMEMDKVEKTEIKPIKAEPEKKVPAGELEDPVDVSFDDEKLRARLKREKEEYAKIKKIKPIEKIKPVKVEKGETEGAGEDDELIKAVKQVMRGRREEPEENDEEIIGGISKLL